MATPGWAARLDAVFGVPVHELDWAALQRARGQVREDDDLDFKETVYGNTDADRRELAGDIASLANRRGGLLLLGVRELDGVADQLVPVPFSDAEEGRMRQIAAQRIAPYLEFSLARVESDANPDEGVYALLIPPSRQRPHAVRVNDALRFPMRDGTTTRWLVESEVRGLYREAFREADGELARLERVADELAAQMPQENEWVSVALVPGGSGDFEITEARLRAMEEWAQQFRSHDIVRGWLGGEHPRAFPDARRVLLTNHLEAPPPYSYLGAHLHIDGPSAVGHRLMFHPDRRPDGVSPVERETLLVTIARCLYVAARHAAENCGGYGEAVVEARLGAPSPLRLYYLDRGQFLQQVGDRSTPPPLTSRGVFTVESLLEPRGVLEATRALDSEFVHAMGSAEVFQIAPGGALRLGYWTGQDELRRWAEQNDVPVAE